MNKFPDGEKQLSLVEFEHGRPREASEHLPPQAASESEHKRPWEASEHVPPQALRQEFAIDDGRGKKFVVLKRTTNGEMEEIKSVESWEEIWDLPRNCTVLTEDSFLKFNPKEIANIVALARRCEITILTCNSRDVSRYRKIHKFKKNIGEGGDREDAEIFFKMRDEGRIEWHPARVPTPERYEHLNAVRPIVNKVCVEMRRDEYEEQGSWESLFPPRWEFGPEGYVFFEDGDVYPQALGLLVAAVATIYFRGVLDGSPAKFYHALIGFYGRGYPGKIRSDFYRFHLKALINRSLKVYRLDGLTARKNELRSLKSAANSLWRMTKNRRAVDLHSAFRILDAAFRRTNPYKENR